MAQLTVYSSADASAPVLHSNADANNLIVLLDAVLVNGYGSKAAAGWTHPFVGSGTEQVYRSGSGTQRYLHILDDGTLTGARRGAAVKGYETMASVSDTTGLPFPTVTQETNGLCWRKSTDISTTARPWIILADNQTFYLFIATGDTGASAGSAPYAWPMFMFGDIFTYIRGDAYNCMIIGVPSAQGFSASTINFGSDTVYEGDRISGSISQTGSLITQVGHYINRASMGTNNSANIYKKGGQFMIGTSGKTSLSGGLALPSGNDGAVVLSPIWIMDSQAPDNLRGELRGLYHQMHDINNFGDGDTIPLAVGDQVARAYAVIKQTPHASGVWVYETTDTVKTN